MQLSKNSLSLQAIWLEVNWSMTDPIYSVSRWLIFFCCCFWHTINCFSFFYWIECLHLCYIHNATWGVLWQNKKSHMTQLSGFKSQASRTDVSLFRSDSLFFFNRLNENIFFLFVSSIFYSLRFRHFGRRFFFHTVDLSRESLVLPPTQQFLRTRIKITFRGRCQPQKLKSAKNKLHVF